NPGAEGHNPLIRGLDAMGGAILGLPGNIAGAFYKPPSPEEQETYRGKIEATNDFSLSDPSSMLKAFAGRGMLGIERMTGGPAVGAAKDYADPKTRPTLKGAASVLPEALG